MHRVQLHYTLSKDAGNALIRNPLPELLQAVAEHGSISGAARALDLSYRHVWGALKRWEDQLGGELIIWGKGQSAQLSEFGTKLLWAGVLYLVTAPLWLLFFFPGWIAWGLISIWFLYRIVRGMVAMGKDQGLYA